MSDAPIACTLTADALRERRAGLLSKLLRSADGREELSDGIRLRFDATDQNLATIIEAVDAERKCCGFLRFAVIVEPGGAPFRLEVTGPPGAREFISALFSA